MSFKKNDIVILEGKKYMVKSCGKKFATISPIETDMWSTMPQDLRRVAISKLEKFKFVGEE